MKKLQEVRKNRGMCQSELATLSGVKLSMIQLYEGDFRDINGANIKTLLKLCLTLNCKISDILDDEEVVAMCIKIGI